MAYGFAYTEPALQYLETVIPKPYRAQIIKRIKALADDPRPSGCKQLHGVTDGQHPVYRIRSGDYRILYSIRESVQTVAVLDIGNRKDVYRRNQ